MKNIQFECEEARKRERKFIFANESAFSVVFVMMLENLVMACHPVVSREFYAPHSRFINFSSSLDGAFSLHIRVSSINRFLRKLKVPSRVCVCFKRFGQGGV